jgi:hypothetical protein
VCSSAVIGIGGTMNSRNASERAVRASGTYQDATTDVST